MRDLASSRVVGKDGLRGTIVRADESARSHMERVLVQFENGLQVMVPVGELQLLENNIYYVPISANEIDSLQQRADNLDSEAMVLPVVEEQARIDKRTVETGVVRVSKVVREREETVDEPLLQETVEVERVAVERLLDGPAEVREEGDTLIIPVVEEVLVLEKRLMLREEVRVTRVKTQISKPQQVTLQSEEVIIDRIPSHEREIGGKESA